MMAITPIQQQVFSDVLAGNSGSITFNRFDPTLGTLVSVIQRIDFQVQGLASIENTGGGDAVANIAVGGQMTLLDPDGALAIGSAEAGQTVTAAVGAFDGNLDFGGTSGTIASTALGTGFRQSTLTAASGTSLVDFIGTGTVDLPFTTRGTASGIGPANLAADILTNLGGTVSLQYEYIPAGETGTTTTGGGLGVGSTNVVGPRFPILISGGTTTTAQTFTLPDALSDWSQTIAVDRFDASLGSLLAINVGLVGTVTGDMHVENLGGTSGHFSGEQIATVDVQVFGTNAVTVTPRIGHFTPLTFGAYDGVTDFAGVSGATTATETNVFPANVVRSITDPAALAAFTGAGARSMTVTADGSATWAGSGNLALRMTQLAGATVTVSYVYDTAPACFAAGTRIATPDGPIAVEHLIPGQVVSLADGGTARIVWIGYRTLDCRRHDQPETVYPIRIVAGAFTPTIPMRDVLLSPDHAILCGDVLIPVRHLVNDTTIRIEPMDRVTYFHVELPRHDVLLAEGLPVESFLDTGNRAAFANAGRVTQMHPRFAAAKREAEGFAPLVITGPRLEAERARLARRAKTGEPPRQQRITRRSGL